MPILSVDSENYAEGSKVEFSLETNSTEKDYAYTLQGDIDVADIARDSLTGTVSTDADGKASISVDLLEDKTTEGAEELKVTLDDYSSSATTTVEDSSIAPPSVSAGSDSYTEGSTAEFNIDSALTDTELSYTLAGDIDVADIAGDSLTGTVSTDADGKASISVDLLEDKTTEGAEELKVTLDDYSSSATTTVEDSKGESVDQVLVPAEPDGYQLGRDGNDYYVVSDNVGKDARTTAVDTEGSNRVQMIDWLDIDSFKAASTQLILTMDNGHEVDIRSANQFDYELGANATTGDTGDVVSYETLLTDSLGLDAVPGEGEVKEGGSTTIIPNKVEIEGNTETNKGVEESFVYEYEYKDGKLVSQEEELVQIDEFTREDTLVLKSMGEEGVDSLSGLKDAITVSEAPIEDKTSLTFNETEETAASTLELMGIVDDTLETIDIAFA